MHRTVRFAGALLAFAGAIAVVALSFHPDEFRADAVLDPRWRPVHDALLISFTLSAPGAMALWAAQQHRFGLVGHAGGILAVIGSTLAVGMVALEAFALPVLARSAPLPLLACVAPDGPLGAGATVLFGLGFVTFLPGWALLGAATARAGILPRNAGALLFLGSVVVALPVHVVGGVGPAAHVLTSLTFGGGWLWTGVALATGGVGSLVRTGQGLVPEGAPTSSVDSTIPLGAPFSKPDR